MSIANMCRILVAACIGGLSASKAPPGAGVSPDDPIPLAWPERPADPAPLSARGVDGPIDLVDLGVHGQGRLQRLDLDTAPGAGPSQVTIELDVGLLRVTVLEISFDSEQPHRGASMESKVFLHSSARVEKRDGGRSMSMSMLDVTLMGVMTRRDMDSRGLALILGSVVGMSAGEQAVAQEMTDRGWTVAWVSPPLRRLQASVVVDDDAAATVEAGRKLARVVDEVLAQRAYAVEGLVEWLEQVEWIDPDRPRVMLGFSIGALALPAAVARLARPPDAAVMVGGGADVLGIATRSSVIGDGLQLHFGEREPTRDEWDAVRSEALRRSATDPAVLAPRLRGTPVLLVHAAFDRIVHAEYGELLHQRLGRPVRWSYPLGHVGLFAILSWKADDIADWIEEKVG